jgi:hypothetical protein
LRAISEGEAISDLPVPDLIVAALGADRAGRRFERIMLATVYWPAAVERTLPLRISTTLCV